MMYNLSCNLGVEVASRAHHNLQVTIDNLPAYLAGRAIKVKAMALRVNLQLLKSYKDINEHKG